MNDIYGHTGEAIWKDRCELVYERALRNGCRDALHPFTLFSIERSEFSFKSTKIIEIAE